MFVGWWLFKDKNFVSLVSQSKDGDILNNLLNKWNYKIIRGSSSKGGKEALHEIIRLTSDNNSAVITPDGPRGPSNEIKNGVLIISKENHIPVIPIRINYLRKKILSKSWDKFEVPVPFSKCEIFFGNKFMYNEIFSDDKLIEFKKKLSAER
jgi:lysophospholipid acyltransferase (LPLAT)-like uncharacterized protein